MSKFRFIDIILNEMFSKHQLIELQRSKKDPDYWKDWSKIQNKDTGEVYLVRSDEIRPNHKVIKRDMPPDEAQKFREKRERRMSARAADIERGKSHKKGHQERIAAVKNVPISSKWDGPENSEDAVGTNPAAERELATRMQQLGKVSADYTIAMKDKITRIRKSNPDILADDAVAQAKKELKKEGIVPPPEFDLCSVSIPGSNLFCGENREIPRKSMPQLKTTAVPGTKAWDIAVEEAKKETEKKGYTVRPEEIEVNAEEEFLKWLEKKGHKISRGDKENPIELPAAELKATQNQMNADKVAGMAHILTTPEENPKAYQALTLPLIVSQDKYIVDGHHRWAARATQDVMDGEQQNVNVRVIQIDVPIEDLIKLSNEFGNEFGLKRKGMGKDSDGEKQKKEKVQNENKLSDKIGRVLRDIKSDAGREYEFDKTLSFRDWAGRSGRAGASGKW